MGLSSPAYRTISALDRWLAGAQVRLRERAGSLVGLFFHGLLDAKELATGAAYPQQGTTPQFFASVIECFQDAQYRFISPEELAEGVDPAQKYALLTFDDGYFNNSRAVPILEKYRAPATIFVSALHVQEERGFWWESLYHLRRKQNRSDQEIGAEMGCLNSLRTPEIIRRVGPELGDNLFAWRGDADRPFRRTELQEISRHPLISIGNHTADHDILTASSADEAEASIATAQEVLAAIIGKRPISIAYPNGSVNESVRRSAERHGLKIGFTAERRKEYLPQALSSERRMLLGRFLPVGNLGAREQADYFRSDLMVLARLQQLKGAIALRSNKG